MPVEPVLTPVPSLLDDPVPPMIQQSLAAYRRDLLDLLSTHHRQWVACDGEVRIGIARTQTELVEACLRRGLRRDEFLVCGIQPESDDELQATPDA
jgi:hypothetical protein